MPFAKLTLRFDCPISACGTYHRSPQHPWSDTIFIHKYCGGWNPICFCKKRRKKNTYCSVQDAYFYIFVDFGTKVCNWKNGGRNILHNLTITMVIARRKLVWWRFESPNFLSAVQFWACLAQCTYTMYSKCRQEMRERERGGEVRRGKWQCSGSIDTAITTARHLCT